MPKMLTDASRKLVWVPTLEDYSAPSAAILNAGLDVSCLVTAANFVLGSTGDDQISDPALCATSNASTPGRTNYEAAMDFFRWTDELEDIAWTTFNAKGLHGYIVQRIGQVPAGTKAHTVDFTAGDEVQVYEAITNTPQVMTPADAGYEKFRQVFSIQENVDERAVVVA